MKPTIVCSLFLAPCLWAQLPDAPGKDDLTKVCSTCHSLDVVSTVRMDGPGWKAEVDKMISRGAEASPEEFETIVTYLAKNLGVQAAAKGGPAPRELPDGPGKPIILRECVGCRQPAAFSTYQHTPEQ